MKNIENQYYLTKDANTTTIMWYVMLLTFQAGLIWLNNLPANILYFGIETLMVIYFVTFNRSDELKKMIKFDKNGSVTNTNPKFAFFLGLIMIIVNAVFVDVHSSLIIAPIFLLYIIHVIEYIQDKQGISQ